ncbi:MAG: hypothetical protein ABI866_02585 [Dokdonella sp.]
MRFIVNGIVPNREQGAEADSNNEEETRDLQRSGNARSFQETRATHSAFVGEAFRPDALHQLRANGIVPKKGQVAETNSNNKAEAQETRPTRSVFLGSSCINVSSAMTIADCADAGDCLVSKVFLPESRHVEDPHLAACCVNRNHLAWRMPASLRTGVEA